MISIGQKLWAPYYKWGDKFYIGKCEHKCFCNGCLKDYILIGFSVIEIIALSKKDLYNVEKTDVKIPKIINYKFGANFYCDHSSNKVTQSTSESLQFNICSMATDFLETLKPFES